MDVKAIRDGIKTRLATISDLRCHDTIPGEIAPPAAVVVPDEPFITYNEAMRKGMCFVRWKVTLLASDASRRTGQDQLDGFLSAGTGMSSSVIDAIEGDKTLGGVVDDTAVDEVRDYGQTEIAGKTYWKADIHGRCLVPRI